MGLFSVVDAILDMPMERLLEHIPLEPDVKDALLGEPGGLRDVLDLAVACASGDWDRLAAPAARLSVPEPELAGLGAKALLWCGSAFGDGSERLAA
jgi:EAL and modified HD-GYP domain-containing signal transduction protein